MSFQEARSAHCRLARYDGRDRQEAEAAWGATIQALEDANVCPVTAELAYSTLISEPTTAGGVGLSAEPRLLQAGVARVGHMCRTVKSAEGHLTHTWREFKAACHNNPRLINDGATAKAWERQVLALQRAGVGPEAALKVTPLKLTMLDKLDRGSLGRAGERQADDSVNDAAVGAMLASLNNPTTRGTREKSRWVRDLQRCFPTTRPAPPATWVHGGRDRDAEAFGARCVLVVNAERTAQVSGGEARWGRRRDPTFEPRGNDERGLHIGADGWVVGHALARAQLLSKYKLDAEGYVVNTAGCRVQGEEMGEMEPAMQLLARARIELGASHPDMEIVDKPPQGKAKKTHVNLHVQRQNREELAEWQTKISATAAYTLDGTRTKFKGEHGEVEHVVARAAARHDGVIKAGRMWEVEGADNYLAELAAQLDALVDENEGGRIILVFDATSPVTAMSKFRKACHRKRNG